MRTIDRLLIKAKKKYGADKLIVAFVYPSDIEEGKWIARGDIWNGIPHSGVTQATCICDTIDEAIQALNELSEEHPNDKDLRIFIDDIKE